MPQFLNTKDIINAVNGAIVNGSAESFSGISIDSRTIKDGELFVALKGDNHDGHDFVRNSLEKGKGAVVRKDWHDSLAVPISNKIFIKVDDTLKALQDMAAFIRDRFDGHVFAVVGSNGKTTTKELLSSIFETRWDVLKTTGNYNNHIGMPLCICRLDAHHQAMLLEMGANRPDDINSLCKIARPDTAVITNIGYEHLEGFGSIEMVRESELEILPYVKKLIANIDDEFLMDGVYKKFTGDLVTFGIQSSSADITARDINLGLTNSTFYLDAFGSSIFIKSRLSGLFNVYNCIAAASVALTSGFNLEEIKKGIESFDGVKLRFELKKHKGVTFINDVYNANPSSMESSIIELVRVFNSPNQNDNGYKRTIVVLGDMLELGDYAVTAHKNIGRRLSELKIDIFIGVGQMMTEALSSFTGNAIHAENSLIAGERLSTMLRKGDVVLIKGSRGMRMENVLGVIERLA